MEKTQGVKEEREQTKVKRSDAEMVSTTDVFKAFSFAACCIISESYNIHIDYVLLALVPTGRCLYSGKCP